MQLKQECVHNFECIEETKFVQILKDIEALNELINIESELLCHNNSEIPIENF